MPTIIINPGTGPVEGASEREAIANAGYLCVDLADFEGDPKVPQADFFRMPERDEDGRYGFRFESGEYSAVVDIPGLPIEQVRYIKAPDQNIWHYPRLYINDSSFVWFYVINLLRRELTGTIER